MHIIEAIGDVKGLVRDDIPTRKGGDKMAKLAGPGESTYTVYDREIAAQAQIWLHDAAKRDARQAVGALRVLRGAALSADRAAGVVSTATSTPICRGPSCTTRAQRPHHPFIDDYARVVDYDTHFKTREDVKRALAGYFGLVSALDENIGKVLRGARASLVSRAIPACCTPATTATTSARAACGASRPSTRNPPACR